MAQTIRPTTCSAMFAVDPALGADGCKRLPRHGGEHRGHLTAAAERKAIAAKAAKAAKVAHVTPAANPRKAAVKVDNRAATQAEIKAAIKAARAASGHPVGRLSAASKRAVVASIMARVTSGDLSVNIALGAVASLA